MKKIYNAKLNNLNDNFFTRLIETGDTTILPESDYNESMDLLVYKVFPGVFQEIITGFKFRQFGIKQRFFKHWIDNRQGVIIGEELSSSQEGLLAIEHYLDTEKDKMRTKLIHQIGSVHEKAWAKANEYNTIQINQEPDNKKRLRRKLK